MVFCVGWWYGIILGGLTLGQYSFRGKALGRKQQSAVSSCCLLSDLFLRWTVSSCPSPAPLLVSFYFPLIRQHGSWKWFLV